VGEGWGEGNSIWPEINADVINRLLLSPALSSIRWRRGSSIAAGFGAVRVDAPGAAPDWKIDSQSGVCVF
jgi:hypothetical protein